MHFIKQQSSFKTPHSTVLSLLPYTYHSFINHLHHTMVQTTQRPESDILRRLKHPEEENQRRRMSKNLFIRNILNGLFILVALVAMIGILVAKNYLMVWYVVGLFAVMIKMVEVMLRMPGMRK